MYYASFVATKGQVVISIMTESQVVSAVLKVDSFGQLIAEMIALKPPIAPTDNGWWPGIFQALAQTAAYGGSVRFNYTFGESSPPVMPS